MKNWPFVTYVVVQGYIDCFHTMVLHCTACQQSGSILLQHGHIGTGIVVQVGCVRTSSFTRTVEISC